MKMLIPVSLLFLSMFALSQPVVYPLHVGDQWTFHGSTFMNPVSSIEVVKDTLMTNGLRYSMVRYHNANEIEYQRYHSDSVFIYDPSQQTEILKYRFNAQENETISTYPYGQSFTDVILTDTSLVTIFGKRVRAFTFSIKPRGTIDATRWVTIADSIGVIDIVQGAGYESILQGAFIDGTAYGTFLPASQPYYPMAVGNKWIVGTAEIKVVGDSLFPNGHVYRVLNKADFAGGTYVRADAHYIYYYDERGLKDVPFFKLDGQRDEATTFNHGCNGYMYSRIIAIDTATMFGETTRLIHYQIDLETERNITLSDKFGLVAFSRHTDPPEPWRYYGDEASGCIIDGRSYGSVTSARVERTQAYEYRLSQNYPNPFNPSTTISFSIPSRSFVSLKIFDLLGREVATLVSEELTAGSHARQWNASGFPSGMYFYRLQAGAYTATKRLLLVK
jgi:hypothetical protein